MHFQYFKRLNVKNSGYLIILNLKQLLVHLFALKYFLNLNALLAPILVNTHMEHR